MVVWGSEIDCMQDGPTPQNPVSQEFEQCGWQYVGGHCHAATEYMSTIGLSVWFKLQASVWYSASHYTIHCLLLRPFPGNVPVLLNTLGTDDAHLRLWVSSMEDGWCKCASLAHVSFPYTIHCSHMSQRSIYCTVVLSDVYSSVGYHDLALNHVSVWRKALCSSQPSYSYSINDPSTSLKCYARRLICIIFKIKENIIAVLSGWNGRMSV
jgi:hypothetical protein